MATLKDVRAAAKKMGATVEDDKIGMSHECRVEAPKGCVWNDGVHEFVASGFRHGASNAPDYADLLDRMSFGFEPCTDAECDWCRPEEGEE